MVLNVSDRNKLIMARVCAARRNLRLALLAVNNVSETAHCVSYGRNLVRERVETRRRVEGYKNFLWIMWLALFRLYHGRLELDIEALGICSARGRSLVSAVPGWSERWAVCLWRGLSRFHSGLAAWSTGGLETTLFASLLLELAYVSTCDRAGTSASRWCWSRRPDSPEPSCFRVTSIHVILEWRQTRKLLSRRLVAWGLVFLAIYVPYYVWRYSYYGYPMPNTFYSKVGSGYFQYVRGAQYLLEYLKWYGGFIFVLPLLTLLRKQREPWRDYVALLVGVYSIYLIYVGGDGLAFFRFVAYIAPLIYVLVRRGSRTFTSGSAVALCAQETGAAASACSWCLSRWRTRCAKPCSPPFPKNRSVRAHSALYFREPPVITMSGLTTTLLTGWRWRPSGWRRMLRRAPWWLLLRQVPSLTI